MEKRGWQANRCSLWVSGLFSQRSCLSNGILVHVLVGACLIAIAWISFSFHLRDARLKIAYYGAGPHGYVAEKLRPEDFKRNWEGVGYGKYDFSLPMRIYYYLARYFHIYPDTTIVPFMLLERVLFVFSVAFLAGVLFRDPIVSILSAAAAVCSPMAGLNLSRFGYGFGSFDPYLFYGYANAFRFAALAFFLKRRYSAAFVLLALGIYSHINMGLFMVAFLGGYILRCPGLLLDSRLRKGLFVFLALVGPFILAVYAGSNLSTGQVPREKWVLLTRIFSYHWYPLTMRIFTEAADMEFFPFLIISLFFFATLGYHRLDDESKHIIISGTVACLVISAAGVVFSDIHPVPFLIKISPQRSTGLITFLATLFLVHYLYKKIRSGGIPVILLSIYTLALLFFSKPGIAVFPLTFLIWDDLREGRLQGLRPDSKSLKVLHGGCLLLLVLLFSAVLVTILGHLYGQKGLLAAFNRFLSRLWTPLQHLDPFEAQDFLLRGGSFRAAISIGLLAWVSLAAAFALRLLRGRRVDACGQWAGVLLVAITLYATWYAERDRYLSWHRRYAQIASSYLDLQLWAKANMPADSLFMPDPSHSYGWRDFSERSSFGNLREWGYASITYNPQKDSYLEGLRRMRAMGIEIEDITEEDLGASRTFIYGQRLVEKVRKAFYSMDEGRIRALAARFHIDYLVMNKKYHKKRFRGLRILYENRHYVLYDLWAHRTSSLKATFEEGKSIF